MVSETTLRPTDPARWWLSYAIERERAEREADRDGTAGSDIEVLDDGRHA